MSLVLGQMGLNPVEGVEATPFLFFASRFGRGPVLSTGKFLDQATQPTMGRRAALGQEHNLGEGQTGVGERQSSQRLFEGFGQHITSLVEFDLYLQISEELEIPVESTDVES